MAIFSSLNRAQKEAVGLLQIGTFLEYFDLMLYVHMAVLLNELFFPKTDPHTAALISAFAFCSTYVLRPFGALLFGYIGDNIGRKTTVIITTMMMSISCVIMANLPIYAQVGITATWVVTLCRIVQGLSSMGEIMGAQIYIAEITKPPVQYSVVSFVNVIAGVGSAAALGVAFLVTAVEFNWRIAFWIGGAVAVIGSVARTRLRESPEFLQGKKMRDKEIKEREASNQVPISRTERIKSYFVNEKNARKDFISYFLCYCGWPVSFYLCYMYFNPLLKSYGYTPEDIIYHNFLLSFFHVAFGVFYSLICFKFHPLKIVKNRLLIFMVFAAILPLLIKSAQSPTHVFCIQVVILLLAIGEMPAAAVFIKHIHVLKRFTVTSFAYAASRALMYIFTSFGLVYFTELFGPYGVWLILIPVAMGVLYGVNHFEKLERKSTENSYQSNTNLKAA